MKEDASKESKVSKIHITLKKNTTRPQDLQIMSNTSLLQFTTFEKLTAYWYVLLLFIQYCA